MPTLGKSPTFLTPKQKWLFVASLRRRVFSPVFPLGALRALSFLPAFRNLF